HAAVVGVRAGPQLARLDVSLGRRIVDRTHARRVAAERPVEPVLWQSQRTGEQPAEARSELGESRVVGLERLLQLGRALGPAEAGHGRAPVERLLQVAGGLLPETGCEALAAQWPVGREAEDRFAVGQRPLLLVREIEEGMRHARCPLGDVVRNAVADDGEEPNVAAGGADLRCNLARVARDIYYGN